MDFLLFFVDEVDDLAGVVGAEGPPPHRAVRVGFVLGAAVPRRELQNVEDFQRRRPELRRGVRRAGRVWAASGTRRYTLGVLASAEQFVHLLHGNGVGVVARLGNLFGLGEYAEVRARVGVFSVSDVLPLAEEFVHSGEVFGLLGPF
ncbi:hypothetical protein G1H10_13310 [Phytoactinopolyspora halotolerans]|uniref:Uncharacterized protein n=1 Tax=Phytoactinopolyspora halotolerans TaxID=1981512 RepID=A0A6L9S6Q8_9ACTN|nr:hypothetical protein [Phytoactinopolyspora halotolerans]NEE01145.1 hypothetical protein [Phytoactinopolyspora halotolerans]